MIGKMARGMTMRRGRALGVAATVSGGFLAMALAIAHPSAQDWDNPLRGTWSGSWQPESGYTAVTVRFSFDGDELVGEMLNPDRIPFSRLEFDEDKLTVSAEGQDPDAGRVSLEATIQEETRLIGTLTRADDGGEMKLTKWTFRP